MVSRSAAELTRRQQNEREYHRERARTQAATLNEPFDWDVLDRPSRRWWNPYWQMYAYLTTLNLTDKRVLVVGCGLGDDALRLAKLGAKVYAFDLSPESLSIASALAEREGLAITFSEMPAEALDYESDFFELIVARDILHHVDVAPALSEIRRVARPSALLLVNEIYSHSIADRVRHSVLVEKMLYPRMQRLIYGPGQPYITEDERKLTEADVRKIMTLFRELVFNKYFNFLVTRVIPDKYALASQVDRLLLIFFKPFGHFLAGRIIVAGTIAKEPSAPSER